MTLRLPLALLLLAAAGPALAAADPAAKKQCVEKLSPEGKKIYAATAPSVKPDTDIRTAIRAAVTPMVMGGEMSIATAQEHGPAAGQCLALLK